MKTYINRILFALGLLFGFQEASNAYITLPSSSFTLEVGVDKYLSVPSGYIDHAVWTCSRSEIFFKQKDAAGAIIQITKSFSGTAIVELLATEKYLDSFGRTRAQTYYKQYLITCSGGSTSEVSEIILPDNINLNVGESKHYKILSGNCYNGAFSLSWKNKNPQNFATFSVNWTTGDIDIAGTMSGSGTLTVTTINGNEKNCKVVVSATKVITSRRTETVALADIKSLIVNTLSTVNASTSEKQKEF